MGMICATTPPPSSASAMSSAPSRRHAKHRRDQQAADAEGNAARRVRAAEGDERVGEQCGRQQEPQRSERDARRRQADFLRLPLP